MDSREGNLARRDFLLLLSAIAASDAPLEGQHPPAGPRFHNMLIQISVSGTPACLWSYRLMASGKEYHIAPPVFNVDNHRYPAVLTNIRHAGKPSRLPSGVMEYRYEGAFAASLSLSLEMRFQAAEDNPIIRFSYVLKGKERHALTKPSGGDDLTYLGMTCSEASHAKEIRFANFLKLTHCYAMEEVPLSPRAFIDGTASIGPMLISSDGQFSDLAAYEHGSQAPDAFMQFKLHPDRWITLQAVKGNYLTGQIVDTRQHYQTVWLEIGAVPGGEDQLAAAFRRFVLKYMSQDLGTRRPHIYYNTWNFQERNKWWYGKGYLHSMNNGRILKEIDAAHRMGIDVYVLDTGWYEKTGDWTVSPRRFPDGLKAVRDRLNAYGMRLGLWFGPTSAAVSSRALNEHRDCIVSWHGVEGKPHPVWQTEASYPMCLVSRYADAFAERLIQLSKEIGVTYFKWDAIGQYGCDSPRHEHGNSSNTPEERSDSYAFQVVHRMAYIAERIAAACPEAVVDYDITEAGRAVGLAFLSSGRYFLINNGPYYFNYDIPFDRQHQNWNIFFYPGPARTWICRTPLTYDKWIPSILFLTHYFPDDPIDSQEVNVASLILGQNGIWGDLLRVSDAGVNFIAETLARYKQVRDAVAASDPIVVGPVSGSPETHEKIESKTGRGAVVVFVTSKGRYSYVTSHKVAAQYWASPNVNVHVGRQGRAKIDLAFDKPGAKIIFFGVE